MAPSPAAKAATIGVIVIVLIGAVGVFWSFTTVSEGHVGVEKTWGDVNGDIKQPGGTFITPIKDGIQRVEVRPRTYTMSQSQGEGDQDSADAITVKTVNGSSVKVDITVRYRIKSEEADTFVNEWNNERQMEQRLIRPTIRSELRDQASDLQTTGPGSIYTTEGREALGQTAETALLNEFADEPITLEAVQIRNIDLPSQIDEALDEKEQAKQRVEVEKEKVSQEEQKARQKEIAAQADAEVIKIKGDALKENQVVLQDRYIEAIKNGSVFVVPNNGSTPVLLNGDDA